jgi:hypothetical protein
LTLPLEFQESAPRAVYRLLLTLFCSTIAVIRKVNVQIDLADANCFNSLVRNLQTLDWILRNACAFLNSGAQTMIDVIVHTAYHNPVLPDRHFYLFLGRECYIDTVSARP